MSRLYIVFSITEIWAMRFPFPGLSGLKNRKKKFLCHSLAFYFCLDSLPGLSDTVEWYISKQVSWLRNFMPLTNNWCNTKYFSGPTSLTYDTFPTLAAVWDPMTALYIIALPLMGTWYLRLTSLWRLQKYGAIDVPLLVSPSQKTESERFWDIFSLIFWSEQAVRPL